MYAWFIQILIWKSAPAIKISLVFSGVLNFIDLEDRQIFSTIWKIVFCKTLFKYYLGFVKF